MQRSLRFCELFLAGVLCLRFTGSGIVRGLKVQSHKYSLICETFFNEAWCPERGLEGNLGSWPGLNLLPS